MSSRYNHKLVEKKWQDLWSDNKIFQPSKDEDKETDINYLENNYVTVVPSQYDMTCFESVENLKKWKI